MNSENFDALRRDSAQDLANRMVSQMAEEEAKLVIKRNLESMVAADKVMIFTEEEEQLMRSFRRFKATCKPGSVFKWQTQPEAGLVVPVADQAVHVQHPQDVSET